MKAKDFEKKSPLLIFLSYFKNHRKLFAVDILCAMGIAYTEKYCQSSIVADINPDCKGFTIAIRTDMDALPVEERTNLAFSSQNPGQMHACGHDCHMAVLLGTAKVLKSIEKELACRVRLIFQPCEEGSNGGGKQMTANGAVDDVDVIVALHVEPLLPTGHIGICPGFYPDDQLIVCQGQDMFRQVF